MRSVMGRIFLFRCRLFISSEEKLKKNQYCLNYSCATDVILSKQLVFSIARNVIMIGLLTD